MQTFISLDEYQVEKFYKLLLHGTEHR